MIQSPDSDTTTPRIERPLTTVDVVIFTLIENILNVLLVQRPNQDGEPFPGLWALPGGFVDVALDDDLRACAVRKLYEKTSVQSPYLEQLGSWGGRTRDPRGWSATHVYFSLQPFDDFPLRKGANAADVRWFIVESAGMVPVDGGLAFDHADILAIAVERLRSKVQYTSLPAFLLQEPFTLPQLQQAYESVVGRRLDKSAFRTRALSIQDFLEETGVQKGRSQRAPMGYRLKNRDQPVTFPRTFQPR